MGSRGTKNAVLENAGLNMCDRKMQDRKMQDLEDAGPGIQTVSFTFTQARYRHQFYTWVSGTINVKDYTETLTLEITCAQIVSCLYYDVWCI